MSIKSSVKSVKKSVGLQGVSDTTILIVSAVALIALYFFLYMSNSVEPFVSSIEPKGNEATVALFYAEWCGHCQDFKPEWAKIESELKGGKKINGKVVTAVAVDAGGDDPAAKALSKQYGVNGFPTIKCIQSGKVDTHEGDRSLSGVMDFIKSVTK